MIKIISYQKEYIYKILYYVRATRSHRFFLYFLYGTAIYMYDFVKAYLICQLNFVDLG